jgi:hypothetical protein
VIFELAKKSVTTDRSAANIINFFKLVEPLTGVELLTGDGFVPGSLLFVVVACPDTSTFSRAYFRQITDGHPDPADVIGVPWPDEILDTNVSVDDQNTTGRSVPISGVDDFLDGRFEPSRMPEREKDPVNLFLVSLRSRKDEEVQLQVLSPTATDAERRRHDWNVKVREIGNEVVDISKGRLKPVNFYYRDALFQVRGHSRPIALTVRPISSNLCLSGVYIYDTTKLPDNRLYLFFGPESPPRLRSQGEKLFELMSSESPGSVFVRIDGNLESADFKRMLHEMGGHVGMIQPATRGGDERLFERQFFATQLRIHVFSGGRDSDIETSRDSFSISSLPDPCSAVIDPGDDSLYLYISDVHSEKESDFEDRRNAIQWLNSQPEYRDRSPFIFDKETIPPPLAILFIRPAEPPPSREDGSGRRYKFPSPP